MHQLDFGRQQLVKPGLHDGMGLPAAYFHDRPLPGKQTSQLGEQPLDKFRVTEFA
jgi:hypothetical protein